MPDAERIRLLRARIEALEERNRLLEELNDVLRDDLARAVTIVRRIERQRGEIP